MKTSKEMQLRILDKMRENVESGHMMYEGVECRYDGHPSSWSEVVNIHHDNFTEWEFRIKPETITINGVEIPKPLGVGEIIPGGHYYFMPCSSNKLFISVDGYQGQKFEYKHLYKTKEEAIEASKLLFGIED